MSYYFSKISKRNFEETIEHTTQQLKEAGFGVLNDIDMQTTLKNKLDVNIRRYRILGACNPPFAFQAIQAEENIGLLLPCNLIVRENNDGQIIVAAIDPVTSMNAVHNPTLAGIAIEVQKKLKGVIEGI